MVRDRGAGAPAKTPRPVRLVVMTVLTLLAALVFAWGMMIAARAFSPERDGAALTYLAIGAGAMLFALTLAVRGVGPSAERRHGGAWAALLVAALGGLAIPYSALLGSVGILVYIPLGVAVAIALRGLAVWE